MKHPKLKHLLVLGLLLFSASACIHPQVKFRKARLLDPTMDPAKTSMLYSGSFQEASVGFENGQTRVGGSLGATCPTCGS